MNDFNDILSSLENTKDVWNELVDRYDANLSVDITFEDICNPLEKVINTIDATNLIFKLRNISEATPAQKVEVLQDVIQFSGVAKVPILSEYFGDSLTVISNTLASVEETFSNEFFKAVATAGSCSEILTIINMFPHSNEARILRDKMKKKRK